MTHYIMNARVAWNIMNIHNLYRLLNLLRILKSEYSFNSAVQLFEPIVNPAF